MSHRIEMWNDGIAVPRLPTQPLLSSARSGWKGISLERHYLPPMPELTGVIDGYQVCLHQTEAVRMHWKLDGEISSRTIQPGELCTSTHGEVRSVSWDAGFETVIASVSLELMSALSAEHGRGRPIELVKHRGFRDPVIENVLRVLESDVAAGSPAGPLYGEQVGTSLALYLSARYASERTDAVACRSALPGPALRRVLAFIDARLDTSITLDELAAQAGMSRFYFARLFRNSTGQSPHAYIVGCRVDRALQMLSKTSISLPEIARRTGFSSHSHLAAVFRSRTGQQPSLFRRLRRNV